MGCTSSKAAAGEVPAHVKAGPTQEDILKANSPPNAPASPTGVSSSSPHNHTTSSVVPLMPVLASDLDASSHPPVNAALSSSSFALSSPSARASASQVHLAATMTLPLSPTSPRPPNLTAISQSLPGPLPPVKVTSQSRVLSVAVRRLPDSSSHSNGGSLTGEQSAKWDTMGSSKDSRDASSQDSSNKDSAAVSRQQSFNSLLAISSPSLNLADPACTSSRIGETFTHYSRKRYEQQPARTRALTSPSSHDRPEKSSEEETMDKKALAQLATDCVLSFLSTLRANMVGKWKDERAREKKEVELRQKLLPGATLEDAVEISRYYLQQELQYKHGHVTRTMFVYHFARCHKAMFSYEKLTVEREALVAKWAALGKAKLEEKKKRETKNRTKGDKGDKGDASEGPESERSDSRRESKCAGKEEKRKKKKRRRSTAPANSIHELLQSTNSKVLQAEKKLTSTFSAASASAAASTPRSEKREKRLTLRKANKTADDQPT